MDRMSNPTPSPQDEQSSNGSDWRKEKLDKRLQSTDTKNHPDDPSRNA